MTREEIFISLNDIFAEVLELESVSLTDATVADDIEGWDSLAHISLIAAIESCFNIHFSMKEILTFHNVGDMVNLIIEKTK